MNPSANSTSQSFRFLARLCAIGLCVSLAGCLTDFHNPIAPTKVALRGDVAGQMSLEKSREFLQEMLEEAKAQRSRGIRVGTPESNAAVLSDLEERCRELLARNEPLKKETASALQATLDALRGRRRWHSVENSDSSSSTTTDDSATTQKCEEKEKDKKCKDHDGDRKKGKDCDERKR